MLAPYLHSSCIIYNTVAVVQLLFVSNSFLPVNCSMPGFPVLHYLLEFA